MEAACPTKRVILSKTARLFDPLGWLAPVVVRAKLLIQTTWLQHLDWDTPVPAKEAAAWSNLEEELPLLTGVRVPRWFGCDVAHDALEIHGFADASERAYAAVVYLRVCRAGRTSVSLALAKTKVADQRRFSLPRLELCAATLLAKLSEYVRSTLSLDSVPVTNWSDSTTVLGWLRGHPARWTTFVANRVAEIHRTAPNVAWRHVPGLENPADCASRGTSPRELIEHPLWWRGPAFLMADAATWPCHALTEDLDDLPEQRPLLGLTASVEQEPEELTRFSSLRRLLRVTAWMRRFCARARAPAGGVPSDRAVSPLTPEELDAALLQWILLVQGTAFRSELDAARAGQGVSKRSPLRRLTPDVDAKGVLRVGGRIKHALLSADQRHPAILPSDSHLTRLIVDDSHKRTLHGGVQLTLAAIRRRFWLLRGRQLVRSHIYRCVRCLRWRAASPQPVMGVLPRARVSPSRPFLHTGVDFAGPILLRTARGRGHKAYKAFVSVFVCFSSRAEHLEVVSDYTSDAFLAAFRRFISRRGLCEAVYSDNGTNFVGADSQLRALFRASNADFHRIVGRLSDNGIQWRFNPPAAPHFGGLWEAAVKAMKHHLKRVIGEATLTFEEMSTLLSEVEASLNSRPLQALTDDPEDLEALTPGHFLIGAPLIAIPEPTLLDTRPNALSRWRLLQQMRDHLWQRWSQEYVQSLAPRAKWWASHGGLREGQLCLLKNESTPPTRWPLVRILRLHPGEDGQARVADIKTPGGQLTRPVIKLVPLCGLDESGDLEA